MPYANENGLIENPSILVSDDKVTWAVPDGLTNPAVPYVAASQNADNDLILIDGVMYIVYIAITGGVTYVKESHSSDGITWSAPAELFHVTEGALVSPAVVTVGNHLEMYSVNTNAEPNTLERRTCTTINGTWSAPVTCTVYLPSGYLWHVDVMYSGGVYYALLNVSQISLWLANSADGLTWAVPSPALLADSGAETWDKHIYRSTAVKTATGFDLWYNGYNTEWHIGYAAVA